MILGAAASFTSSGPAIKLTFPGERSPLTLQFTDEFPANWQDAAAPLPAETNTIELPLVGSQRFYRLKR